MATSPTHERKAFGTAPETLSAHHAGRIPHVQSTADLEAETYECREYKKRLLQHDARRITGAEDVDT